MARRALAFALAGVATVFAVAYAAPARAAEWHGSLEDGLAAAAESRKPVLVVTLWKQSVCQPCDRWRAEVKDDALLAKWLHRVEPVLWEYDGLHGKVIEWTFGQGNQNPDPSALVWLVHADGRPTADLRGGGQYRAAEMVKWLGESLAKYEQLHPRTRVPFVRVEVVRKDAKSVVCAAFEAARREAKPIALYFGRDRFEEKDRVARAEWKKARALEKSLLDAKLVAAAAGGWVLLRFDLADPDHAAWARERGIAAAPALAIWPRGGEALELLDTSVSPAVLARVFKARSGMAKGDEENEANEADEAAPGGAGGAGGASADGEPGEGE